MTSSSMCVLPWIHLASHPNGGCSLCCRSNHTDAISWAKKEKTNSLLKLSENSLDEIINSEKFVEVRQAMINGERPVECEGCWRDEDAGIESKRQYENKRWAHILEELEQGSYIHKPNYRYIELRLGNVCNSKCITCNSYSSSKWYPDEKEISKELKWFELRPVENFKWFEDPAFYDELTKCSEGVEEIYINGGEPTLIKAHYRYLENLVANGTAMKVHLVYSLNMIDIPNTLIDLWKNFKKVTVNASIDDLGERNYYIRYPSEWKDTVSSIEKLNNIDNVEWHVTQTVSILNIDGLHTFGNWLKTNYNKIPHHNYVLYPEYFSVAALPDNYKEHLKRLYADKLEEWQRNDLYGKLETPHQKDLTVKAKEFINALDRTRELDYKNYLPHLDEIFENYNE